MLHLKSSYSLLRDRIAASPILIRLVNGAIWGGLNAVLIKGSALIQGILLARLLGAESFGEWGILNTTLAIVSAITIFGLNSSVAKFTAALVANGSDDLGPILSSHLIIAFLVGIVTCVLVLLFAPLLANELFNVPRLALPIRLISVIALLQAIVGVFNGILMGYERFKVMAKVDGICSVVGACLVVILAIPFGLLGALFGLLASRLLMLTLGARFVGIILQEKNVKLAIRYDARIVRSVLGLAFPLLLSGLVALPAQWIALLALAQQAGGYAEVGGFYAANQWRTFVVFLPHQLMVAFIPVLSSVFQDSIQQANRVNRMMFWLVFAVAAIISLPLLMFSSQVMELYGEGFELFYLALIIMVIKGFFESISAVFKKSLISMGRGWLLLMPEITSLLCVLTIGVPFLIPEYLAAGAALTFLLAQVLQFLTLYGAYRVKLKQPLRDSTSAI